MAALPANDSVTCSVRRRFCDPVRKYWPRAFRRSSMLSLMYGNRSGAYWTSSKMTGAGCISKKTARVGRRRGAHVGRLQRDIAGRFAEDMLQHCGLARLAWPRQDHGGELGGSLSQNWLQRTRNVTADASTDLHLQLCITNAYLQMQFATADER